MKDVIIIPTYNERLNIGVLIPAILVTVPGVHIVVVDDNSPDGTAEVVRALAEEHPTVRLLFREKKEGLGRAYSHAFRDVLNDAEVATIIMMDADFSHDPSYLPAMLAARGSHDVVIGSRYVRGGRTIGWEKWRLLLSFFGNLYARLITRLPVRDITAGFYAIDANQLRKTPLEKMDLSGYAFQIELKYLLWKSGARMHELPITFRNRREGESKLSGHIVSEGIIAPWKILLK